MKTISYNFIQVPWCLTQLSNHISPPEDSTLEGSCSFVSAFASVVEYIQA
jgi:hypothetical protein